MTDARLAALGTDIWEYTVERSPILKLRYGLPVDRLPTGSLAEVEEESAFFAATLTALATIDRSALDGDDAVTHAFLEDLARTSAGAVDRWWWHFACTPYQLYGLSILPQQVMPTIAPDATELRASLTDDYRNAVRAVHDKLRAQAERGWRIPRPALAGATATVEGLQIAAAGLFEGDEGVDLAFDALLAELGDEYAAAAPDTVGLCHYPGGEEAYAALVRHHATFPITPEEIHRIGLAQVEELTEQMAEVRGSLGFSGNEDAFLDRVAADGRLYATGPDDVEARYRAAIARIEPALADVFSVLPRAEYDVARLDPALEAGMTYGYYQFPTDAEPVGLYRYNGSGLDTRSQLNAAAIIYHELVPGHHFHIARQTENEALPNVRRDGVLGIGAFSAYTEGWAEYASHLAGELGMYEDPYDRYGRLVHERFVAQRLVVDSGLNAFGWPLDQARDFMARMTAESPTQVGTETLRYGSDLPGQAIAYRIGDLKLRELRDKMRAARGASFDIRDFHEAVLGPGALPLSVLEQTIT